MIARRFFAALIVAVMITTGAVAQETEGKKPQAVSKKELAGTWLLTIIPEGPGAPPPFPGLYTFMADGTAFFSSVGPPIPGLGNPGHGVWVRTGPTTFRATFKQFTFDDIFTTNGSLVVTSTITMTGADEYTSVEMGNVLDLAGNVVFPIGGTVRARRMKVE